MPYRSRKVLSEGSPLQLWHDHIDFVCIWVLESCFCQKSRSLSGSQHCREFFKNAFESKNSHKEGVFGGLFLWKIENAFFSLLIFYIARGYAVRALMYLRAFWYMEFQREGTQDREFYCKKYFFPCNSTMEMRLLKALAVFYSVQSNSELHITIFL